MSEPDDLDRLDRGLLGRDLWERIGWLEVRADRVGDLDPERLRDQAPCRLLYTLRSEAEGGGSSEGQGDRARRLERASRGYDLVDLEIDRDRDEKLLAAIPEERRLLSWHGPPKRVESLKRRLTAMDEVGGRYRKLVPVAQRGGDEVAAVLLQAAHPERDDLIAFSAGEVGAWTRVVAVHLGAPLVYGSLSGRPAAPGQPSVSTMVADYGLPTAGRVERTFGIVGCPVAQSLSPRLHNGAYQDLGLRFRFLPFHAESLAVFWRSVIDTRLFDLLGMPLAGLSVTAPHKASALEVVDEVDRRSRAIESANTLIRDLETSARRAGGGAWSATTTDPDGVLGPLRLRDRVREGMAAVVVGCGGAGRAAALGLRDAGCSVTLANRTRARGQEAARLLGLPFVPLSELDLESFRVVVHATALGHSQDDPLPFELDRVRADATIVDLVYDREPTPLAVEAGARGLEVVDGVEVLLHQAVEQFRRMTGESLPLERAARRLRSRPAASQRDGGST